MRSFGEGFGPGAGPGHDAWGGGLRGGWAGRGQAWAGPGPWGGGRRMRRGDIRRALLKALLDGPAHGYELMGRLEDRSGGMWRPSPGSVYPTLQMLEEEGLITGRDQDGRRVYELTESGRESAAAHLGHDAAAHDESVSRMQLRRSLETLVMAARQVSMAGDESQVDQAVQIVADARQRLYRLLAGD